MFVLTGDQLLAAFDAHRPEPPVSPSGFSELDSLTGGMLPGRVWIVVSVPGEGRTTLLTQWAAAIAQRSGQVVHLATPRERADVIVSRLLSLAGKIPLDRLTAGDVADTGGERIDMARSQVCSLALYLYALDEDVYVPEVHPWRAKARPTAVLIDDADLVPGLTPERLTEYAASGLFVAISLPRHKVMTDETDEADLNPAWARAADVVMEVRHRGLPTLPGQCRPGEADLHIRQNRWGYIRTIPAHYQAHYSRFIEAGP